MAVEQWVHNDGTLCADWSRCDTYEHHRPDGSETITKIKAKPSCAHGPESYCQVCEPELWAKAEANMKTLMTSTAPPEQRDGNVGELIDGRIDVYGDPATGFIRHAQVWSGILGIEVQPWQVALCMLGYKLVRTSITPDYSDNSDDIDGYLDIFRTLMGDGMVQARDTAEYLANGGQGARA